MLTRIRPRRVIDLARRDLPQPLDVINLITTGRFEAYKWYGVFVLPLMALVGGRLRWMGRHEQSLHGDVQAEKLLIVRYPSQRRFLAMTLNPYYLAINRLREAGVRRFEASFTHASHTAADLGSRRLLVAAHFDARNGEDALEAVERILAPVAGELVYATRAVASLGFLEPPSPTDPNPLRFSQLALFAVPGDELPEAALAALVQELGAATGGFALQAYCRESQRAYRPSLRPARAVA